MRNRWIAAIPLLVVTFTFIFAAFDLPEFGNPSSPASTHISPRYIEKAMAETGAPNMVTAVLIDYRGYDTLGETAVVFAAGLACLIILGLFKESSREK